MQLETWQIINSEIKKYAVAEGSYGTTIWKNEIEIDTKLGNVKIRVGEDSKCFGADNDIFICNKVLTERTQKGNEFIRYIFEESKEAMEELLTEIEECQGDGKIEVSVNIGKAENEEIDDENDLKWLTVPEGQLTFSSEGNDDEESIYFTRKPHVPKRKNKKTNKWETIGASGITIGRGLDIGSRESSEVENIFSTISKNKQCLPINENLLEWLKNGAGLKYQEVLDYYFTLDEKIAVEKEKVITRKQQHFLFIHIFKDYVKIAKSTMKTNNIVFEELPKEIRDVLVDMTYVGHNSPKERNIFTPILKSCIKTKNYNDFIKEYLEKKYNKKNDIRWRNRIKWIENNLELIK